MSEKSERAAERKQSGMNCAQAVASVFKDESGLDEETVLAATQTFGTGIGASMAGTCGAVTGAAFILGMAGKDKPRGENMKKARELVQKFKEKNGSVTCCELKGIGTGKVLRSCEGCVRDAAEILEDILSEK